MKQRSARAENSAAFVWTGSTETKGNTAQFPLDGLSTVPAAVP